jgi:hypothetical protein
MSGDCLGKAKKRSSGSGQPGETSVRMNPESRLCARFDSSGIALFPTAEKDEMGVRVVDNFCEEHIM